MHTYTHTYTNIIAYTQGAGHRADVTASRVVKKRDFNHELSSKLTKSFQIEISWTFINICRVFHFL